MILLRAELCNFKFLNLYLEASFASRVVVNETEIITLLKVPSGTILHGQHRETVTPHLRHSYLGCSFLKHSYLRYSYLKFHS